MPSLALLVLCVSHTAFAQTVSNQLAATRATAPTAATSPLHFQISTPKTTYHVGEAIPVDLAFSSDVAAAFRVFTGESDRDTGANLDVPVVDPSTSFTELSPDQQALLWHMFGNGRDTTEEPLPSPAFHLTIFLNRRLALDKPGHFRLHFESSRVFADLGPNADAPPFQLRSNDVELTIVPATVAWRATELADIRSTLDTTQPFRSAAEEMVRKTAIARLAFLNSDESARELVRRLQSSPFSERPEIAASLAATTHTRAALDEMYKLLADPNAEILKDFAEMMAGLPLLASKDRAAALDDGIDDAEAAVDLKLLNSLSAKSGLAFAGTFEAAEVMRGEGNTNLDAVKQYVPKLIGEFGQLPPDYQTVWLSQYWDDVKSSDWIPTLRQLISEQSATGSTDDVENRGLIASQALSDWAEIDPAGARESLLTEMTSAASQIDTASFFALTDKTVPDEQQRQLAQLFVASSTPEAATRFASLIERFGGQVAWDGISRSVTQSLRSYDCDTQAYLVKFALRTAGDAGESVFESAMVPPDNGDTRDCRAEVLGNLRKQEAGENIEDFAIRALNDSDPVLVRSAASYLGQYGSAKAEDPLWARFQVWANVSTTAKGSPEISNDSMVGIRLAFALMQGRSWIAGREELQRLQVLAGPMGKTIVSDKLLDQWSNPPLAVHCAPAGDHNQYRFAQYIADSVDDMKARLALLPSGTSLAWDGAACASEPDYSTIFNDLASATSLNGVMLKPSQPQPPLLTPNAAGDDPTISAAQSPDPDEVVADRVVTVQ